MNRYEQYRFLIPVLLISLGSSLGRAQGQSFTPIYTFDCMVEGCSPVSPAMLAQGTDGNLYGTLPSGAGAGSSFEFPMGSKLALTNFGSSGLMESKSGFTLGIDGNLYGTVDHLNGSANPGAVIRLSPPSPGLSAPGPPSVVFAFASWNGFPLPTFPEAPPIQGTDFNLYGVTNDGGNSGTVYQVLLNTSTGQGTPGWSHQLPSNSSAPLLLGSDGNLYGTYESGTFSSSSVPFAGGCGGIFQITPAGVLGWHYNLGANGSGEGCGPHGGVMQAADGYLYGTASAGGKTSTAVGVVFKIALNGSGYKVIHSFESADGQTPHGGLVQGSNSFLYGFASTNGPTSIPGIGSITPSGTLFRVFPDGTNYKVLQPFFGLPGTSPVCGMNNKNDDCGPGTDPESTPTLHTNGTLFGLTKTGGEATSSHGNAGNFDDAGEFFSLNDGLGPFVSVVGRRSAHVGDRVGIIGQGFLNATGVTFGGVAASFTKVNVILWSDNFISVVVPPGARSGPVTVQEPTGNLSTLYNFSIVCNFPICAPLIPR